MRSLNVFRAITTEIGVAQIIGEDPRLHEVSRALQRAAGSDTTVLLLGESGTGKEEVARLVHALDARTNKADMVTLDCTTVIEPGNRVEVDPIGNLLLAV